MQPSIASAKANGRLSELPALWERDAPPPLSQNSRDGRSLNIDNFEMRPWKS